MSGQTANIYIQEKKSPAPAIIQHRKSQDILILFLNKTKSGIFLASRKRYSLQRIRILYLYPFSWPIDSKKYDIFVKQATIYQVNILLY